MCVIIYKTSHPIWHRRGERNVRYCGEVSTKRWLDLRQWVLLTAECRDISDRVKNLNQYSMECLLEMKV